jgi:two-component system, response regulator, stage 0 sporulation protein F
VRQKILLIDDEEDFCSLILRILSEADYQTACAFSLAEGKRKWELWQPAIVLLDYNLPDGTGLDLLESNPHFLRQSLVVLITADAQESTRERAKRLGVPVLMHKPFSMYDLRRVIESLLIHA